MSDNQESQNQNTQQALENLTMAETEPSSPLPPITPKNPPPSFSIWPPTERTRDAVRTRLIETLSSPSVLTKRYGTVSRDEAVEAAKIIEEEAFVAAGKGSSSDEDGIEILQVYSKEISKRMLEIVKGRSDESGKANEASVKAAEDEDAGSNAPPVSERTESVADDE